MRFSLTNLNDMKQQRLFFALCLSLLVTSQISAQTYNTAIGIRFDDGVNITAKQFLTGKDYLELMVHAPVFSNDIGFTALWERHRKVLTRNTSFYYGAGPHLYLRNQGRALDTEYNKNVIGLSGIMGIDFCIGRINLSVDVLPELHLTGEATRALDFNGVSFSARYIFNKKERKKLRDRVDIPDNWRKRNQKKSGKRSSL